jgi:phosphohistidine phosphatase
MPDRDRPLNRRGRSDAALVGTYLAHSELVPDRVLCSPAERTRQTWDMVARQLPKQPADDFDDRLYDASLPTLLALLAETAPRVHALLVVGHNPTMHQAALTLIATGDVEARERLHEKFPTAALAVIDFAQDDWSKLHPRSGRLDRFVTPRQLAAAPD